MTTVPAFHARQIRHEPDQAATIFHHTDSECRIGQTIRDPVAGDGDLPLCHGCLVLSEQTKVYIEPRPKGRPEGTPIDQYSVEDHANSILAITTKQEEAVDWAKAHGRSPIMVARVRNTDKGNPDHWRPHS